MENGAESRELVRIRIDMDLEWKFARGWSFGEFFRQFKGGNIVGIKCPQCGRVYLPPRPVCGNCYEEMHEWINVSDEGTIRAFTVVYNSITDPVTGRPRKTPYGMALIQLDRSDTLLNHYVDQIDLSHLAIGRRVKAVFHEERRGAMSDIAYFRLLEE